MPIYDFLTNSPQPAVTAIAALIAAAALRSTRHLTRAKHTLDFDKEFKEKNKASLLRAFNVLRTHSTEALKELGENGSMSTDASDPYTSLVEALNAWEGVSIGLEHKVYNEMMLFEAYGSTIAKLYIHSIPFIKARASDNPRYFKHFVKLGLRWASWLCKDKGFDASLFPKGHKDRTPAHEDACNHWLAQKNWQKHAQIPFTNRRAILRIESTKYLASRSGGDGHIASGQ